MSIYLNSYPEWDSFWENLKDDNVTDLNALPAMDEMACFGANDRRDNYSATPTAKLEAVKEGCYVEGDGFDDDLTAAYTAGYNNEPDFTSANPDPSKLPTRPPR